LLKRHLKARRELNDEYKLTERAAASLSGAVERGQEAAGRANTSA
jgi:hypothetical protein